MLDTPFKFEKFLDVVPLLISRIDRVVGQYIFQLRRLKPPLMEQLNRLGDEQLHEVAKERLSLFLKNVLDGEPFHDVREFANNWKKDKLHANISKDDIKPQDIILGYLARKNAFVSFLPELVKDQQEVFAVLAELDEYNAYVENILFDTYIKIHQERLFISEERSRALAEASFEGIAIHDKQQILDANEQMLRYFGYSYEEMLGMDVMKLVSPEAISQTRSNIDQGYGEAYESVGLRRDGSRFPMFIHGKDIKFKGRQLRVTAVRDLTYIKDIEQQLTEKSNRLEEKERRLRSVLDNIKDVFFQTDTEGNWIYLNNSWNEITGFQVEDTLGKPLLEYVHVEDQPGNLQLFVDLINRKKDYCRHVVRYKTTSGEYKWIDVHARLTFGDNDTILGTTGTLRDITDYKKAELALSETYIKVKEAEESLKAINNQLEERVELRTKELESKNKELNITNTKLTKINADLDNFIYTASHDLKAPILNLEGLLNALHGKVDSNNMQVANLLRMMHNSIERFKTTIKDLTEISKIQKNLEEENKERILVGEMLTDVQSDIKELIDASGAEIESDFHLANEVLFSRKNLRSILYNLLSNSIKYRALDRKPKVIVKTEQLGNGTTVLSVKDNGLGFKQNQADQVFTMFKRMHTHVEGSGIGLYIVKRMVENAGGKIEVQSEEGVGTEFRITIPDCLETISNQYAL